MYRPASAFFAESWKEFAGTCLLILFSEKK